MYVRLDMHMQMCECMDGVKHIYAEVTLPAGHYPVPLCTDRITSTGLLKHCNSVTIITSCYASPNGTSLLESFRVHPHTLNEPTASSGHRDRAACYFFLQVCFFQKFPSKPEHHRTSKRQIVGSLVSREVLRPRTQSSSTEQRSLVLPSSLALVCLTHLLPDKYKESAPSLG